AKAQKEKESIQNVLKNLQQELNQKEQAKKQLDKLTSLNHWLTDYFMKLMDQIEKHVLLSVYHQFNGLFQNWFSLLIEEETMQARLDDAFTPIIELNGYETDLQHLSGGEKTSCALAYRLALNKVINDLISTIHTRDLIILDEPTDGFSTEQLDRVREVLDELGIEQVILVSHEPKMESFVDSIIKVSKEQHESKITAL
ncbi:MAG: SMC family ATPase, partial [Candidatus Nanoarchaeia archaeon]